jgi:fructose-1,6-bisphosphatase/inositol monophosphatase family enzyme
MRALLLSIHSSSTDLFELLEIAKGAASLAAAVHRGAIGRVDLQFDTKQALIRTGFLPDQEVRRKQAELLREILPRVRDIRRSGCPSLDICSVASGTLDAFYECGLGPWDISGATAIAEAA